MLPRHYVRMLAGLFLIFAVSAAFDAQARSWLGSLFESRGETTIAVTQLPAEAQRTLAAIHAGGPYDYPKDGSVFGNYEHQLPSRPRGFYTEFTVRTPGLRSRGARRIIAGDASGTSPVYYYTDDHYQSFRRIQE